jgi:hypothetical protein
VLARRVKSTPNVFSFYLIKQGKECLTMTYLQSVMSTVGLDTAAPNCYAMLSIRNAQSEFSLSAAKLRRDFQLAASAGRSTATGTRSLFRSETGLHDIRFVRLFILACRMRTPSVYSGYCRQHWLLFCVNRGAVHIKISKVYQSVILAMQSCHDIWRISCTIT